MPEDFAQVAVVALTCPLSGNFFGASELRGTWDGLLLGSTNIYWDGATTKG